MSVIYQIKILGEPVIKTRARHRVIKNADNTVRFVQTYSDQSDVEAQVKKQIKAELRGMKRLDGYVEIFFVFTLTRPKNHWRTGTAAGKIKESFIQALPERKDYDNLEKFYADACRGILFEDDCKVMGGHAFKFYESEHISPMTQIYARKITHKQPHTNMRGQMIKHLELFYQGAHVDNLGLSQNFPCQQPEV